jgi:hypothetical protein
MPEMSSNVVDTWCVWATQSASSSADRCAACHEKNPRRPVSRTATAKPAFTFRRSRHLRFRFLDPVQQPVQLLLTALECLLHLSSLRVAALDDESHPGDEANQRRALEKTASALTSTQVK